MFACACAHSPTRRALAAGHQGQRDDLPADPACLRAFPSASVRAPATPQSLLTGESVAVEKHVESVPSEHAVYQDKTNILFSVRGWAEGR